MKTDTETRSWMQTGGGIAFMAASAILFLGSIAIFIWLITDAAEHHLIRNVLFGASFLIITLGLLIYSIACYRHPRHAAAAMWVCLIIGLASYVAGLCVHSGKAMLPPAEVQAIENNQ